MGITELWLCVAGFLKALGVINISWLWIILPEAIVCAIYFILIIMAFIDIKKGVSFDE